MDFKARNPILPRWTYDQLNSLRHPMPYLMPYFGDVIELDAPDRSTIFLAFRGRCDFDEVMIVNYLIEARPDDVMRRAYEAGDINMEDFWDHRGWLIRMETRLVDYDDPPIQYVHPSQMDRESRAKLQSFGDLSPYEHLIKIYTNIVELSKAFGDDTSEYQWRIDELIQNMPPRQGLLTSKKVA